jgi:hypothetical protein
MIKNQIYRQSKLSELYCSALIALILIPSVSFTADPPAKIRIGVEARVPENPRSHYSRYVNWRPANDEVVHLNPPRMSWPYVPNGIPNWYSASHIFTLQISSTPDFSNPLVIVTCSYNFYNMLPELKGTDRWYWRVGYDIGSDSETWSQTRSFSIGKDATIWDRSNLAKDPLKGIGHPRILFNTENLSTIQKLAKTHPGSRAALARMQRDAEKILQKPWWNNFPKTDRSTEPKQEFYKIADDLATVCFVWRMTGDPKYAAVKDHALTWASYPPGGRASPEGLGGDGNEDATQGNEFLSLLFDWLYTDLTEEQQNIMIHSLEWRIDHWINAFAWHSRNNENMDASEVRYRSLAGTISSHQYEGSMDNAICALALYEHSPIAREWYNLILNYMIGISSGHGFDEAWNEGPGYGTSKFKWFMNASMYYDTTLPTANLGKNPFYQNIGDWFCRVIPMGMTHNAWGNQNNASKWNHRATMRKLAHLTGQGRFLLNWQQYGGKDYAKFRPWIEYVLPAYYQEPKPEPESEHIALFAIDGWATAASGPPSLLSTYEQGIGMIFQSRPRGGFSHSFNSDNSFQLHAFGQMLNHGGGSSANQDAYAYHTMSHNTILVDGLGQAQPDRGQIHPTYGRIAGFSRGDNYVYVAGDATNCYPKEPGDYSRWSLPLHKIYQERALPYLKHFVRHILFVRNRYFVIFDDLFSTKPATFTWLYHILPNDPLTFDEKTFRIDYRVGDTHVRLQQIANANKLILDNRQGEDGFVNPFTGEDYRKYRKSDILAGHNLWISNREPSKEWTFLTVVYPTMPGETIPDIHRIDNNTVRVGEDTISFDPESPAASKANFLIDPKAMR